MTVARFDAIVFDLFNTIVRWTPGRLPTLERNGRRFPSTLPLLFPILERALASAFDEEGFVEEYLSVLQEIEVERGLDSIEITCHERFERTLRRVAVPATEVEALAGKLTRTHMAAVRSVTAAPSAWAEAVRRVGHAGYRTAILSNFDDGRTGHEIVADTGLGDLFEIVVISADEGLRKPHPELFRRLLARLGLDAGRVLYVGDTPREDVLGARGVGMPVVWLNEGRGDLPADVPDPDFILPDVTALPALLGLE